MKSRRAPFVIADSEIAAGQRATVAIEVAKLYTKTELFMNAHIIHGKQEGPVLFLSAAIHGDEINGVEIIRRVLRLKMLNSLRGTLIAVPVVNTFGFIHGSRYSPDRRDLNRFFPGSEKGSLTSRLASIFMKQVVARSTHGIDFHTASHFKNNLPQIRAQLANQETRNMAEAFGAPVMIDANLRDGSLRQAALEFGVPILLYEGGQALMFDEVPIRVGVKGVISVMRSLKMLPQSKKKKQKIEPVLAHSSTWARALGSGIFLPKFKLGDIVQRGDDLGIVTDPLGESERSTPSPVDGVVIGKLESPLVHKGDAVCHIATVHDSQPLETTIDFFQSEYETDRDIDWRWP